MIILTGNNGFIGKVFENAIDPDNLYRVEFGGAFLFLEDDLQIFEAENFAEAFTRIS